MGPRGRPRIRKAVPSSCWTGLKEQKKIKSCYTQNLQATIEGTNAIWNNVELFSE